MNDTAAAPAETPADTKTVIRPDLNRYVRAKSGNGKRTHRTDDFVARTLDGKTLDQIKEGAALLGIDHEKWSGLNNGQQRMLIGNAIRNRLTAKKEPLAESVVTDVFGAPAEPYDAEKAAAEAAAKAAEKAEKEAAKAAKKAEAASGGEGEEEAKTDDAGGEGKKSKRKSKAA